MKKKKEKNESDENETENEDDDIYEEIDTSKKKLPNQHN